MSVPPGGGYQPPNRPGGYPSGGYQSSGYQGLGVYSTQPGDGSGPPGPGNRRWLLISACAAAVVVIAVAVTLVVLNRGSGDNQQQAAASTDATTPPTGSTGQATRKSTASTTNNPLGGRPTGPPQVPGWTVVALSHTGEFNSPLAYDVPPDWAPIEGRITFGDADQTFLLFAPAMYQKGFCSAHPSSARSGAGVSVSDEKDAAKAAEAVARKILELYPLDPGGPAPTMDVGQAQPVTVNRDKKGYTLTARAAYTQPSGGCGDAKSAAVSVMALEPNANNPDSVVVFVAYADQGVSGATPERDLQQIVLSLHQVG